MPSARARSAGAASSHPGGGRHRGEECSAGGGDDPCREQPAEARGERGQHRPGEKYPEARNHHVAAIKAPCQRDHQRRGDRIGQRVDRHQQPCLGFRHAEVAQHRRQDADHHEGADADHEITQAERVERERRARRFPRLGRRHRCAPEAPGGQASPVENIT